MKSYVKLILSYSLLKLKCSQKIFFYMILFSDRTQFSQNAFDILSKKKKKDRNQ